MKWRRYPSYKPSGVEWLGEVPAHWEVVRFAREVHIQEGQVDPETDPYSEMLLIAPNHVESGTGRLLLRETAQEQAAESGKYLCRRGAVIYSKIRPALVKATIAPEDCLCSADMYPLSAGPILTNEFLLWLILSEPFTAWSVLEADRVAMPKINRESLKALQIPRPTRAEQMEIDRYLRSQATRIDELIARKGALTVLLQEKRSALISRTVTRGLPPEAARTAGLEPEPKLKASGIEWLGDVPQHWSVTRIKHVARIESGHTPSRSIDEYWVDCTIPWVSLNDSGYLRTHDYIAETAYRISELGLANSSARVLPPRAVVFSRDATVGLCAITTQPMAVSQHFVAYLCGESLRPEYLLFSLTAMTQHLERLSLGATIATIGMDDVRGLICAVPPLGEQDAIVDYLGRETSRIDRMIAKVEEAIERLQEYRSALITAAVTGKIDIREIAEAVPPAATA